MAELTSLDKEILCILTQDGRAPATEIANRLGVPTSTVRNRIQRLEKLGVISGYKAIINRKKLGFGLKAVVQVQREYTREYDDLLAELSQVDEVVDVVLPTGSTDALVTIWAKDVDHLRHLLYEKLNVMTGVVRNNTLVALRDEAFPPPINLADRIVDDNLED